VRLLQPVLASRPGFRPHVAVVFDARREPRSRTEDGDESATTHAGLDEVEDLRHAIVEVLPRHGELWVDMDL